MAIAAMFYCKEDTLYTQEMMITTDQHLLKTSLTPLKCFAWIELQTARLPFWKGILQDLSCDAYLVLPEDAFFFLAASIS